MADVIIIGAGMAGLSAALELKQKGVSFLLLEAQEKPGGRATTHHFASGTVADMGAHWLHGKKNPLKSLLDRYGLSYCKDDAKHVHIFENGKVRQTSVDKWLKEATDAKKAKHLKSGETPDCPMPNVGKKAAGEKTLRTFARMWNAIDPPVEPSALEFLTDDSTPGGLQINGGMKALIDKITEEIGTENIHYGVVVRKIMPDSKGVYIESMDETKWHARKVILTASPAVLQSETIFFPSSLQMKLKPHLSSLVTGKMAKIIIELEPSFFDKRKIPEDMSIELLDHIPPHFCHIRSAGMPTITLFVSGVQAEIVEGMDALQALAYANRVLAPPQGTSRF